MLRAVPNIITKTSAKKPKTKARKPKTGSTLLPKSPIYKALHEFFQNDGVAQVALYVLGIVKGAFFPVCAYATSHGIVWEWSFPTAGAILLTIFCLAFSVPTALQFGRVAFDGIKGNGFAIGLELAMLTAYKPLALVALGLLVVINILAAFYNLRSGKQFTDIVEKLEVPQTAKNVLSIAS
jgi:hypothetical protein